MPTQRIFVMLLRLAGLAGALVILHDPTSGAQTSDLTASNTWSTADTADHERVLLRFEARVSFPQSIYSNGLAWLQTLSIPPFAPIDRNAAYSNAVPSRYSQFSKLDYGLVFLDSIATRHFSLTNPGNARRLALATGMEFLSFRMARSERWRRLWWLPQTLSIGINLRDFRSTFEATQATTSEAAQPSPLPSRSNAH